jgi:hypothetical protein
VAAGDRGDPAAIETVWRSWLRDPDDERWGLLSRWRGSRAAADAACEAALVALPERTLANFCVSHDLTPTDQVRRAVFLMLTGQSGQYRAADPDGSLLAMGYVAASDAEREHLRTAMSGSGDLDLVRVVSVRRETARTLTDAEREYLAAELSRRRDWPGLWRLALGFPLAGAIAAVRRIDGGWRPDDHHDRDLFGRLRGAASADPPPTDEAPSTVSIELPDHYIQGGSFSPDGRRLAVAFSHATFAGQSFQMSVCEIELPHGTAVARYVFADKWPLKVLHLGGVIVAMVRDREGATGLYRLAGGGQDKLVHDGFEALVPYAGGFAALRYDNGYRLVCYDHAAQQIADVRLAETPAVAGSLLLAASPGNEPGPLVTAASDRAWVYTPFAERMAFRRPPSLPLVCAGLFLPEPDRLLVWNSGHLTASRLTDNGLAHERFRYSASATPGERIVAAAHFPQQGKLAILKAVTWMIGPLDYADAATFGPAGWRGGLAGKTGNCLLAGLDGTHGIGSGRTATIAYAQHPLTALLGQPMSAMTPADLSAVMGALRYRDLFPATRPVLELLAACLEHRFGGDVAIGESASAPEADGIGLSARDGP